MGLDWTGLDWTGLEAGGGGKGLFMALSSGVNLGGLTTASLAQNLGRKPGQNTMEMGLLKKLVMTTDGNVSHVCCVCARMG